MTVLPTALSADGSTIAGTDVTLAQGWRFQHGDGMRVLNIPGASQVVPRSDAQSISANGSKVVGTAVFANNERRAFLWDVSAGTYILLPEGPAPEALRLQGAGSPPGVWTVIPTDPIISDDGLVVVGGGRAVRTVNGSVATEIPGWPFRWTAANGTSDSPQAASFPRQLLIQGFSGDGSTIIAQQISGSGIQPQSVANRDGTATTLFTTNSRPTAASYDGQIIWGTTGTFPFEPFRWEQGLLPYSNPRFVARSITDDGLLVTGVIRDSPNIGSNKPWIFNRTGDVSVFNLPLYDYLTSPLDGYGFSFSNTTLPNPLIPYVITDRIGKTFLVAGGTRITRIPQLQYVALGDSFSSGEGVPVDGNFDTSNFPYGLYLCHKSFLAYPTQVRPRGSPRSFKKFDLEGQVGWRFFHAACSGAVTANVTPIPGSNMTGGQHGTEYQKAYVDEDTDLITITIGGNDAWFSEVLTDCASQGDCENSTALPEPSTTWRQYLPHWIRTEVKSNITKVYADLKAAAPNATIVVLGYPRLFSEGDSCAGSLLVELGLSVEERRFLNRMTDAMNETIKKATDAAGVHYISTADAFDGHDVCALGNSWIVEPLYGRPKPYWLHPTREGQLVMSKLVNDFLERAGLGAEHTYTAAGLPKNPDPIVP